MAHGILLDDVWVETHMSKPAPVLGLAILLLATTQANAAPITAFEEIGDSTCVFSSTGTTGCADLLRDLYRTRDNGLGSVLTENTDSVITGTVASGGNAVDANFGLYNVLGNNVSPDVSYTHVTSWLPTNTFTSAILTLHAFDPGGQNDVVLADAIDLGTLTMGSGVTTTTFTSTTFPNILVQLLDGQLLIQVNKTNNDAINLFRSRLTVTYDDGTSSQLPGVPEPASMLLLGTGLAGLAARRRLRARRS